MALSVKLPKESKAICVEHGGDKGHSPTKVYVKYEQICLQVHEENGIELGGQLHPLMCFRDAR